MRKTKAALAATIFAMALTACGDAGGGGSRDWVRAVGSSTVFPFAKTVAESLSRSNPGIKSPIVESTGTGGGIQLFCQGIGPDTPDIANASRRMKPQEFAGCQSNGVTEIMEMQVGLDGIAFGSAQGGIMMDLTPEIVYEAIAANPYGNEQTNETWSDIDPSLPNVPILVYGPPSTSGTRDALKELILEVGCKTDPEMETLEESDEEAYSRTCTEVRSDGAYVDQGEQDNLIVQKIENNPRAIGIFGYSYLEENANKVQGLPINGVAPTYENITSFAYPGARPMFIYVKKAHLDAIPGLKEYLLEWTRSWDKDGPLARIGLVPSPEDVRAQSQRVATEYVTLDGSELE
ncbi:substrate-binding domain-containing protein [Qipengyuania sp. DY56-A-20]|uniref:Substrate-binding domain-containing protein n=1 Tax=Qipengyuania benthica TaxID=3067651 RepID=A0ABT9H929_9SPHN|nr:substrate-binding domain-containing protein [Qipengyuania sp. DY56-A-20]MDP4539365.1 substrate-binding domain-containing protein [Qipengyuania sp. DY56-A-20]